VPKSFKLTEIQIDTFQLDSYHLDDDVFKCVGTIPPFSDFNYWSKRIMDRQS